MKIVIVSYIDWYEKRLKYIEEYYKELNYEIEYIQADFSHIRKEYETKRTGINYIHVPRYKRNFSVKRIISYYIFGKKLYKELQDQNPDIIYCLFPPNLTAYFVAKYVNKKSCKLILDVLDLWPETLPINPKYKSFLKLPNFIWRKLRTSAITRAEVVVLECGLFRDILGMELNGIENHVAYLCKKDIATVRLSVPTQKIVLCYLGSINSIIDIELIIEILVKLNCHKKASLEIIGIGEYKHFLLSRLRDNDIEYVDYGGVFDEQKKHIIMGNCSYGLNIMKETVIVGLTTKSIDYLQAGLPLINNIGSDTFKIVEKEMIGFNISKSNIDNCIEMIVKTSDEELLEMKKRSHKTYTSNFSEQIFREKISSILSAI